VYQGALFIHPKVRIPILLIPNPVVRHHADIRIAHYVLQQRVDAVTHMPPVQVRRPLVPIQIAEVVLVVGCSMQIVETVDLVEDVK
jgi:hypothetical protein